METHNVTWMKTKTPTLRRKLGVSTVVATMLMILITLALGSILIVWAGSTYGSFAGFSQLFFQQKSQALPEKLVVENAFFTKSSSQLKTFVRNVGAEELNIVAIYVNGTAFTFTRASGGPSVSLLNCAAKQMPNGNWVVNETVGRVCEFDLTIPSSMDSSCSPSPWCTGDLFNIVVATATGNQAIFTARGP